MNLISNEFARQGNSSLKRALSGFPYAKYAQQKNKE